MSNKKTTLPILNEIIPFSIYTIDYDWDEKGNIVQRQFKKEGDAKATKITFNPDKNGYEIRMVFLDGYTHTVFYPKDHVDVP